MDMQEVDFGLSRELRWRAFRRRVVLLAAVVGVLEFVGTPALRISTATHRGPAHYVGLEGPFSGSRGPVQPLVVMVPLERSVIARVGDVASALWAEWFRAGS